MDMTIPCGHNPFEAAAASASAGFSRPCEARKTVRLLVVPGLHGSGPDHWQSWLQRHHRDSVRVEQEDWAEPALDRWAARIGATVSRQPDTLWVAAAHSFGCLALARFLALGGEGVAAALLVAPADPDKFNLPTALPQQALQIRTTLVSSSNDPWMSANSARVWALRWGAHHIELADAGHINTESGFGCFPKAKSLVDRMMRTVQKESRTAGFGCHG
jgi:hypothetical protein